MIELVNAPAPLRVAPSRGRQILAIDDSQTLRQFIARCLVRSSDEVEILLAKDAAEGLEIARREKPDLILLDFVLPDMNGGEVCRELLATPETAGIPVVLMSSSSAEMQATQDAYENVVKSIAKPFSPELLNATVNFVVRQIINPAPVAAAAAPVTKPAPAASESAAPAESDRILFRSKSRDIPILSALLAIEHGQLTGILRMTAEGIPLEGYFSDGRCRLVSSRDVDACLVIPGALPAPIEKNTLDELAEAQRTTGCPFYFALAERGTITPAEAIKRSRDQGLALFARVWTGVGEFEFTALDGLPDFARKLPPFEGPMSEWAMETLRLVGDECQSSMAWGEPTGVPAYTRRGYERIQQIPLNDEEIAFAGQISPAHSLGDIAATLQISVETAQRILHRFLSLEILDYWPASLLRRA